MVVSEQPANPVEPGSQADGWTQPGAVPPVGEPSYTQNVGPVGEPVWNNGGSGRPVHQQSDQENRSQGNQPWQPEQNTQPNYTQDGRQTYSQNARQNDGQNGQQGYTQPSYYPNTQQGGNYQNQTQYQAHYQTEYQSQGNNQSGMSVASLVMGILSLVACCCGWVGIVLGVLGIVFALMSRNDRQPMNGQAKAGLIMSCVGIGLNIICIILMVVFQVSALLPEIMNY